MKVAFAAPANGEVYLASKKAVSRLMKASCPELQFLAFQTMHTPRMSRSIPYLATFSNRYVRVLSVPSEIASDELREAFETVALPHICQRVQQFIHSSHFWPSVLVSITGSIHEVNCMEGGLFPNAEEIDSIVRRNPSLVCRFSSPHSQK